MLADADEGGVTLLDLRDELAATRQLVVALSLACQAPHLPDIERQALGELANVIRERLGTSIAALDARVAADRKAAATSSAGADP